MCFFPPLLEISVLSVNSIPFSTESLNNACHHKAALHKWVSQMWKQLPETSWGRNLERPGCQGEPVCVSEMPHNCSVYIYLYIKADVYNGLRNCLKPYQWSLVSGTKFSRQTALSKSIQHEEQRQSVLWDWLWNWADSTWLLLSGIV